MFPQGARVLVALSGGPDSIALLDILRELERRGELTVAAIGHFNHQLRGREADDDELFCVALGTGLGIPVEVGRADVRGLARAERKSIEDAARTARYAFLDDAADRTGADVIAVGHTRDDQAETFLLRLLRGAGPRGLAGIHPRAGRVVRPLLEIPRDELRSYVRDQQLAFRTDASNVDVDIPRNRIRHELLPWLETFTPGVAAVLAREAAVARDDEDRLHEEAIDLAGLIVLTTDGRVELDAAALRALPRALASRVARMAMERAAPGRFVGYEHIERALELAGEDSAGSVSLPGHVATRSGSRIVFGARLDPAFSNFFRIPLSIPGEVTVPGWAVSAHLPEGDAPWVQTNSRVVVDSGRLKLPLAVRSRRPGDRFRPKGLAGRSRKLQDVLVDEKVPRAERDLLPLVVDANDRIVWIAGHAVGEDFGVTEPSQAVIFLKVRRLGGLG
jgi:tRNA(Ile)-lysidine synthase